MRPISQTSHTAPTPQTTDQKSTDQASGSTLVRGLHRLITYGQHPEVRARHLGNWEAHFAAERAAGQPRLVRATSIGRSAGSHLLSRATGGDKTALPAGMFCLVLALGSVALALVPDQPIPVRVHLNVAFGLAVLAAVFVVWPRWQPPWVLAGGSAAATSGLVQGMPAAVFERIGDYVIFVGSIVVTLAVIPFVFFAASGAVRWRGPGFAIMAIGTVLIGLGNLDWWAATQDATYAAVCFVNGAFTLLMANSLMRLRSQTDDEPNRFAL